MCIYCENMRGFDDIERGDEIEWNGGWEDLNGSAAAINGDLLGPLSERQLNVVCGDFDISFQILVGEEVKSLLTVPGA